MSEMGAAEFKAHCLRVMEEVQRTRRELVVTKRGVPMVRIVPADPRSPARALFGCMAGEMEIVGDVVASARTDAEWDRLARERQEPRAKASRRRTRRA
jgi:prevent-host-death family protein